MALTSTALYASELLSVRQVACRPESCGAGEERGGAMTDWNGADAQSIGARVD